MNPVVKIVRRLLREMPLPIRGCSLTLIAVAPLLLLASSANAACGWMGTGPRGPIALPMLGHAGNGHDERFGSGSEDSIVGLWQVVYTAGGATFNQTLDEWHSDGTEFENAWLPPDTGNICFGVWKEVGPRTVRLHHIGWLFTPGSTPPTASGTFTLDETNTVSRDGKTYSGNFTFKTFDVTGTATGVEVTGTIAATRITVE
jgi:hypothetical protein